MADGLNGMIGLPRLTGRGLIEGTRPTLPF